MAELKLAISRGFIQLAMTDPDGKITQKGGFVEDWLNGRLWVLIDVENSKVVDGSFKLQEILKRALAYAKEKAKEPVLLDSCDDCSERNKPCTQSEDEVANCKKLRKPSQ